MPTRMYVTCPSYALCGPAERARTLKTAQVWADAFGWEVVASPLLERYLQPGSWLPIAARAEDLVHALEHEIVWACRGGYSAVHLVPALLDAPPANAPLLIGYSDITVLHACWDVRGWMQRAYGSFAEQIDESRRAASMAAFLRGEPLVLSHTTEAAGIVLQPGAVRAPLFAACLVVLANLCGTPAMPALRGRILAIEDVHERPYAIDFALHQLALSGELDGIAGLLCGSFQNQVEAEYGGPTVREILRDWAERLGVPCIAQLPFGHLDDPLVVPVGMPVEIEAAADGRWSVRWDARNEA